MSGSLNKVTLIGNLAADPEMRRTADGRQVANLRMATSESWKDKSTGEKKEKTEWHRVTCLNEGLCGIIEKYVTKGSKIYVEGQLQTRKWTDKEGVERYSTEIVLQGFNGQIILLGDKSRGDRSESEVYSDKPKARSQMDDEIPF